MYYTKYSNDKINLNEAFGKGRVLKMKMNYKTELFFAQWNIRPSSLVKGLLRLEFAQTVVFF